MNKTKIEWCDMTWNPVTGCLYGCEYCYARKIARRFASGEGWEYSKVKNEVREKILDKGKLKEAGIIHETDNKMYYPFGFDPTFHKQRLDEPAKIKKSQNIFVCSMADLFGEWVPDEWIERVFEACMVAPQHKYLFLTKNPDRYDAFFRCWEAPENFWFGTTINHSERDYYRAGMNNTFLSIEPIQSDFNCDCWTDTDWVIIGAETGNRKGKIIPKKEWIENIVNYCKEKNVPVFMKNSLKDIWQEPLIQEFPWRDV